MIFDFIKYFPLELRWDLSPCDPRGASFKNARGVELKFDGNIIEFKAPRHAPQYSSDRQKSASKNDLAKMDVLSSFRSELMMNDHWNHFTCFSRKWAFWGPWFSGVRAYASVHVDLICRSEEHQYEGGSFFNAKMFESVVVDYLNACYGHKVGPNNLPGYIGPLNWNAIDIGVFCANFEIQQMNIDTPQNEPVRRMLFPVSDDVFVDVVFYPRVPINTQDNGERVVKPDRIYDLRDSVMGSFKVRLSEKNKAHYAEVNGGLENAKLTNHFAPLNWPILNKAELDQVEQAKLLESE